MSDLIIENGKIYLDGKLKNANLTVKDGKIASISEKPNSQNSSEVIDASGKIVLPGGVDAHTHILDLIFSYREDFYTGTQAAAAGGITTVLEMPLGIEGKTALESFEMQLAEMKKKCIVDYGLIGSAGHNTIDLIQKLAKRGVVGFKTFMIHASEEESELKDLDAKNDYFLLKIFEEIAKTGLVSCVHAENDAIIAHQIATLTKEGKTDFDAHTASRPPISEVEACLRAMVLANKAKVKLNLVHMSSIEAFTYIGQAKTKGWDVSCEITPHHLYFTSEDLSKIGTWLKVNPPIKSQAHRDFAWDALNKGIIDMVASDHSPYSHEEKDLALKNNNIFEIGSGTTGLDTMLPSLLNAVNKKRVSLKRFVESTSTTPAKRFGLYPRKGTIAIGSDADLIIVDMQKEYTSKKEDMFTKLKINVYDGMKMQGKIEKTIVRGQVVFDNGKFQVKKGYGEYITPNNRDYIS